MIDPVPAHPHRPLLIGHRGAPGYRPEHTESAYRLAIAQGVDAVEPDLVVSRDGVLVIRHENEISGTTDVADRPEFADKRVTKTVDGDTLTGWFTEDFTWAELSTLRSRERIAELRPANCAYDGAQPILRLGDLLRIVDTENQQRERKVGLVIELKHCHFLMTQGYDLVALLQAELAQTHWNDRPELLTIESFELAPLDRLREAALPAKLVFLLETQGAPADELAEHGTGARAYSWYRSDDGLRELSGRVHGISIAKRDLLRTDSRGKILGIEDIVERAHARSLEVYAWTLRPENRFLAKEFRIGRSASAWGNWQAEWRLILSSKLDGIFLDHPDLLAQVTINR
jgi:glycerophosphoryl diester phosphodiesterase